MFYEADTREYSVDQFFDRFQHDLPQLVKVANGYQGDNVDETIDRGQVIRIHDCHSQSRVLASVLNDPTNCFGGNNVLSFPLSLEVFLSRTKETKPKKDKLLQDLAVELNLPEEVYLTRPQAFRFLGKIIQVKPNIRLLLHQIYETHYLYGNLVNEDIIPISTAERQRILYAKPDKKELSAYETISVAGDKDSENVYDEITSTDINMASKDTVQTNKGSGEFAFVKADKLPDLFVVKTEKQHYQRQLPNVQPESATPESDARPVTNVQQSIEKEYIALFSDNKAPPDISGLSIQEVGEYLRVLNLGHHQKMFSDELIDGSLLKDLDERILVEELNFKRFEAIKLMKFVRDGHLPKVSTSIV